MERWKFVRKGFSFKTEEAVQYDFTFENLMEVRRGQIVRTFVLFIDYKNRFWQSKQETFMGSVREIWGNKQTI
jgi:hypothetical protein